MRQTTTTFRSRSRTVTSLTPPRTSTVRVSIAIPNRTLIPCLLTPFSVYYARYIDWSLTTPLLLLDLCLLAGLSGGHTIMAIVADIIMILTGLFAAYGSETTPQKWGWYAIACIAYLVVIWHLALHGRGTAMAKGGNVAKFFGAIGGFTLIIWTVYPM